MNTPETFHSDKHLAARYDVSRCTIWRWVARGQLPPPVKLSPGCARWPHTVLVAFEQGKGGRQP